MGESSRHEVTGMQKWLSGVRGLVVMAVFWAAAWGVVGGGVMEAFVDPHGEIEDIWPNVLAIPGFVGGVLFYAMLCITSVRDRFHEWSLPRGGALGAVPGLLLGALLVYLGAFVPLFPSVWLRTAVLVGPAVLLGAVSGAGAALMFRHVARHRPATGARSAA